MEFVADRCESLVLMCTILSFCIARCRADPLVVDFPLTRSLNRSASGVDTLSATNAGLVDWHPSVIVLLPYVDHA